MQGKFDMFVQLYWFLGAEAENLKHVTCIYTMRELLKNKGDDTGGKDGDAVYEANAVLMLCY